MASSFIFFFRLCHFLPENPRARLIPSLLGSQDPSEPTTRGSTTPRCCVLFNFPCLCLLESISAAEWNRDVDDDGRVQVTTRSRLSPELSTARLTETVWQNFSVSSATSPKIEL